MPDDVKVSICYMTEALQHKLMGQHAGQISDPVLFASVDEAKRAPFPEGYSCAHIRAADGQHYYSPATGWEFVEPAEA